MELVLSALLWCAAAPPEPSYRPVPLLIDYGTTARIERMEEYARGLRAEGRVEEARRYEEAAERLRKDQLREDRGEPPRPLNPLQPWIRRGLRRAVQLR